MGKSTLVTGPLLAAALVGSVLMGSVATAPPASAQTTTGGSKNGSGSSVGIVKNRKPATGTYTNRCDLEAVLPENPDNPKGPRGPKLVKAEVMAGTLVWQTCRKISTGQIVAGPRVVPYRPPGVEFAIATVVVPDPVPAFTPPVATLPGVLTTLNRGDEGVLSATATLGLDTVTGYAALSETTYSFDGEVVVCPSVGWLAGALDPEPCLYRFHGAPRDLAITVTQRWAMWWNDQNGAITLLPDHLATVTVPYRIGSASTRVSRAGWTRGLLDRLGG